MRSRLITSADICVTSWDLAVKDVLEFDMRRPTTSAESVPTTATDTDTTPFVSGLK
jgi:hypothetical protein